MKLGAGLSKLKSDKSQLARLIKLRKDSMYVKEGKTPSFDAAELTDSINSKIDEIRELKVRIMKTNLGTEIEDLALAEAIIKVGDLRSKIANLTELIEFDRRYSWLDRDDKEVDYTPQINESLIEEEARKLEQEKVKLDNEIQKMNWTVELVE